MSFTINDVIQIAFFQFIYIVFFIYLTARELNCVPKTSLLWLLVGVDILYIVMLACLAYIVMQGITGSVTAQFRWNTLLLSILIPCFLILLAFSIYNVRKDISYRNRTL